MGKLGVHIQVSTDGTELRGGGGGFLIKERVGGVVIHVDTVGKIVSRKSY